MHKPSMKTKILCTVLSAWTVKFTVEPSPVFVLSVVQIGWSLNLPLESQTKISPVTIPVISTLDSFPTESFSDNIITYPPVSYKHLTLPTICSV